VVNIGAFLAGIQLHSTGVILKDFSPEGSGEQQSETCTSTLRCARRILRKLRM